MFDRSVLSGLALAILCGPLPALGQNVTCNPPPNGTRNPGILYYSANPLPQNAVIQIGQFPRTLTLAYVIPNASSPPRPGILAVKIGRENLNSGSQSRGGANTVHIKRGPYEYVCGFGNIRAVYYAGFGGTWAPVDDHVSLSDYIYYHKTTSDYTQKTLANFHLNYKDLQGICTRTDDKRNGNREQFLHGSDRERDNRIVWARVASGAAVAAKTLAKGAPAPFADWFGSVADTAQQTANQYSAVTAIDLKYGQLETQIVPYSTATSSCVGLQILDVQSGQRITIAINDLEQRASNGRRHPVRIEQRWTITGQ